MAGTVGFAPGPRFEEARETAGFTQTDFGITTGMGQSAVSKFERGTRTIRGKLARKIALALGYPGVPEAIQAEVLTVVRSNGSREKGSQDDGAASS
jgi:transcriptional regulator with XRE-family HTH domain